MKAKHYETIFILKPVLIGTEVTDIIAEFRNLLIAEKAEIVRERELGMKSLAYPIKAESRGIYHLIEFKAQPKSKDLFINMLKRADQVMRYISIRLDKDGIEYNMNQERSDAVVHNSTEPRNAT